MNYRLHVGSLSLPHQKYIHLLDHRSTITYNFATNSERDCSGPVAYIHIYLLVKNHEQNIRESHRDINRKGSLIGKYPCSRSTRGHSRYLPNPVIFEKNCEEVFCNLQHFVSAVRLARTPLLNRAVIASTTNFDFFFFLSFILYSSTYWVADLRIFFYNFNSQSRDPTYRPTEPALRIRARTIYSIPYFSSTTATTTTMDRRTKITYIKYIIAKTIAAAVFLGTLHIAHVAWFLFFSPNALLRRDRDRSRRGLRGVVRGRQVRWRNVRPVPFKGFGDERR